LGTRKSSDAWALRAYLVMLLLIRVNGGNLCFQEDAMAMKVEREALITEVRETKAGNGVMVHLQVIGGEMTACYVANEDLDKYAVKARTMTMVDLSFAPHSIVSEVRKKKDGTMETERKQLYSCRMFMQEKTG
jgi:hypothetical protein